MDNSMQRYWILVASKDHVKSGVADGIVQAFRYGFFEINQQDFNLVWVKFLEALLR